MKLILLLAISLGAAKDEYECLGVPVRLWVHQGWRKSSFGDIIANSDEYTRWADELHNNIGDFDFGFSTFMDRLDGCSDELTDLTTQMWLMKMEAFSLIIGSRSQEPNKSDDGPEDSLSDIPYILNTDIMEYVESQLKIFVIVTDDYGKYHKMESNHPTNPALEGTKVWDDPWNNKICDTDYQYLEPSVYMPTIKKSNLHMVVLCTSDEVCDWWDKFFTDNGFNANDGQYLIRPVGTSAKELSDEIIASVNELNCVLKTTTTGPPETSTHTNTDTTTTSPSSGTTTTTSLSSGTTTTTSPGSTTTDTTPGTTPGKNQGPVIIGSAAAGTLVLLLGGVGAYRQLTGAPPELDVEEEEGGNDHGNGAQREAVVAVDEQQYA